MNALRIVKTYPDETYTDGVNCFYRWVCEKVILENLDGLELSMPFYRNRRDVVVGVHAPNEIWLNLNPFAYELFNQIIGGTCYIIFEEIENKNEFDLWCNIIKQDLLKKGCSKKSFNY
jgi:hypothetical protein